MNDIETFYGLIDTSTDALKVFQLCRNGQLGRIRRRLHESERKIIRSGSVFVFSEVESNMKRWTDGKMWSPSRILGHFLIYRELENHGALRKFSEPFQSIDPTALLRNEPIVNKDRSKFKFNGLIKKTISVTMDNDIQHMICYYSNNEFKNGKLDDPKAMEMTAVLERISTPSDIILNNDFRKKKKDSRNVRFSQANENFKIVNNYPQLQNFKEEYVFNTNEANLSNDAAWESVWDELNGNEFKMNFH